MVFPGPFLLSGASAEGEAARDVEDALAAVGRVRRDLAGRFKTLTEPRPAYSRVDCLDRTLLVRSYREITPVLESHWS